MGPETYELTVVSDEVISLALKRAPGAYRRPGGPRGDAFLFRRAGSGPKTWPVPADPDSGSQTIYLLSLKKQGSTARSAASPPFLPPDPRFLRRTSSRTRSPSPSRRSRRPSCAAATRSST